MRIDEMWEMTMDELYLHLEAEKLQRKRQKELAAWHAAVMVSCWSTKPVSPARLLGYSTPIG